MSHEFRARRIGRATEKDDGQPEFIRSVVRGLPNFTGEKDLSTLPL